MVLIATQFFKFDVISLANFLRYVVNGERDIVRKQSLAVFDGKDDVVVGIVYIVVGMLKGHALVYQETKVSWTFLSGTPRQAAGKTAVAVF